MQDCECLLHILIEVETLDGLVSGKLGHMYC